MIVSSSSVSLSAAHLQASTTTSRTTVRTWGADHAPVEGTAPTRQPARGPDGGHHHHPTGTAPPAGRGPVRPVGEGRSVGDGRSEGDGRVEGDGRDRLPPRLAALLAAIEQLTGERVNILRPDELTPSGGDQPPVTAAGRGWGGAGASIETTTTVSEVEAVSLQASGSVQTADGRSIDLSVDLSMIRAESATISTRVTVGAPEPKDPLLLSFGGAPQLAAGAGAVLDLDGDGTTESMPLPGPGSAYLAYDRNGDGAVNSGAELFGPSSGDGFADLAGYDRDGNGWIDEADPVFGDLRLWDSSGLRTLAQAGVGAIGLAHVATPFDLAGGRLRAGGVWLAEDGRVGTVHQVDVLTSSVDLVG